MRSFFIIIGLVFVLGGFHAVTDPRPFVSSMGGYRSGLTGTVTFNPETAIYFGYASIGAGLLVIITSFSARWLSKKGALLAKRYLLRPRDDLGVDNPERPEPKPMARPQASGVKVVRGYPPLKRDP